MAFELNLRIGRNREEKRSLPSEEEKIVEVRDKTARETTCFGKVSRTGYAVIDRV